MGALLQWRPLREMERMRSAFDRMFDRMFKDWPTEIAAYVAPVESFVRNDMLVVRAYLPGLEPKDINISVLGNVLTIRGERKNGEEINEQDYFQREIAYGAFERQINIPSSAKTDDVKAEFKNGVVEITIPLTKEVTAKKVPLVETK
jgi:HSP20 family protein